MINKEKANAVKIFELIYKDLNSIRDNLASIKYSVQEYSGCIKYDYIEQLDVLDKYDTDCTLESKMKKLVSLHNEFEKAFNSYKDYIRETF